MIPQQTFESYPVFGDNATKVAPDNAKYSAGFQQADVLPAEWMNWAWNKNTKGITDLNAGADSIEKEIINVLDAASVTPDAETNNQLLASINYLITQAETRAKLAAHPIGSLYWSSQSTDPGTLFGGTWQRLKDTFIWAAGDSDTVNATGGAKTVTLEVANLPSHNHTFTGSAVTSGASSASNTGNTQPTFTGSAVTSGSGGNWMFRIRRFAEAADAETIISTSVKTNLTVTQAGGSDCTGNRVQRVSNTNPEYTKVEHTGHTHSVTASGTVQNHSHDMKHTHSVTAAGSVGYTGSGTAVNKMPPYTVKYCWERVS